MDTSKNSSTQNNAIKTQLVKPESIIIDDDVVEIFPDEVESSSEMKPEGVGKPNVRTNLNGSQKNHGIRIKNSSSLPDKTLVNINGVLYLLEKIPDTPTEQKQTQKTGPIIRNKLLGQPNNSSNEIGKLKKFTSILDQPAPCPHCGKILKRRRNLKLHMQVCNNNLFYSCGACSYKTTNENLLSLHLTGCRIRNSTPKPNNEKGMFSSMCLKCNVSMYTKECNKCSSLTRWQCKNCKKDFKNYPEVKYHYKTVCKPARYYHCLKCDYRSVFKVRAQQHVRKTHLEPDNVSKHIKKVFVANGIEHTCSKCGKKFDEAIQLNRHSWMCKRWSQIDSESVESSGNVAQKRPTVESASLKRFIIRCCKTCNKNIELEESHVTLQKSCSDCSSTLMFKCTRCDNLAENYDTIVKHVTVCSKENNIKCDQCDFVTDTNRKLTEHQKTLHVDISATCTNCGSYFTSEFFFERHIRYCGVSETMKCHKCPFMTSSEYNLQNHISTVHEKPKAVDMNNKTSAARCSFSRIRPYIMTYCLKCNRRQPTTSRLKYCKICKSELQFRCITCDKMHPIDDPEACEHIKSYLEQIAYECKVCGKGFINEKSYRLHADWCGTIRSFSCKLCEYSTKFRTCLKRHEKQVHHMIGRWSSRMNKNIAENRNRRNETCLTEEPYLEMNEDSNSLPPQEPVEDVKNFSDFATYIDDSENKLNLQCKVVLTRLNI